MRGLVAPLILVTARARRRPARWLLPTFGLALATAFACAIAAEGTITGDRAAHRVLSSATPAQRAVTVTWQGPASPSVDRRARALLDGLGLTSQTRIILLNPVRLSGVVVRPAAIAPLAPWVPGTGSQLSHCRSRDCPMLLVSGRLSDHRLTAAGVRITVAGRGVLRSAAPLGFAPSVTRGQPVLVSGDPAGLGAVAGLSGIYRTQSWLALPALAHLQSWQLAAMQQRLQAAQAGLARTDSRFSLGAPFAVLQSARARAAEAPRRLALAGGGALAALAMFVVLAAYGLRLDQRDELARLRAAGARRHQLLTFALAEAGWLSAVGLLIGAALGVAAAAVLASAAGLPAGPVLSHSLITSTGLLVLLGGFAVAVCLIGCVLLIPGGAVADILAVAAAASLALALSRGATSGGTLALLLAPLTCLAAGALVYRLAGSLLRAGERLSRRGPIPVRLAIVSLGREPTAPALAVAFVAVSIGLAGFALGYRATLERGAADQAAQLVPLDARITSSASFTTPLQVASLSRWRTLSGGGTVLPVRRTYASYLDGGAANTVPMLGVPAAGLALIHDWRSDNGSTSAAVMARRLAPHGPVRTPGPSLPAGSDYLNVRMSAAGGVEVSADLRSLSGAVTQVPLGLALPHTRTARIKLGPGRHELEALQLDEPSGLASTNGHQLAENGDPSTQSSFAVTLGPARASRGHDAGPSLSLRGWRGVGAASPSAGHSANVRVLFADTGETGIVRPRQPSDSHPVPVLVDPGTAGAATASGGLALNVDGQPVAAQIVGVLARFATIAAGGTGFVIADESTLAGALDASLPGQGRSDELWIATSGTARLRSALASGSLGSLGASWRSDLQRSLRSDPIADGVLDGLIAAAAVASVLAIVGLLVALVGAMRQPEAERDLEIQGLGPRELGIELRLRVLVAGALGTLAGLVVAIVLTRLGVATVRAAGGVALPDPPLTAVSPVGELLLLALLAIGAFALASWLVVRLLMAHRRSW